MSDSEFRRNGLTTDGPAPHWIFRKLNVLHSSLSAYARSPRQQFGSDALQHVSAALQAAIETLCHTEQLSSRNGQVRGSTWLFELPSE